MRRLRRHLMDRRAFVQLLAAFAAAPVKIPVGRVFQSPQGLPPLRVVSSYAPAATPGMPGPYPGLSLIHI